MKKIIELIDYMIEDTESELRIINDGSHIHETIFNNGRIDALRELLRKIKENDKTKSKKN